MVFLIGFLFAFHEQGVWQGILNIGVDETTDFFKAGAGSMDVVRCVEEKF